MEKILAIDDSKLVRDMLKSLLTENQFAVDVAANAEEGLYYITRNPYDLIIVDYMLPGMNGLQLLTLIKEKKPELPVIILTSKGNEGIAVQAMKLGAVDYVVKSSDFILQLPLIIRQAMKTHKEMIQETEFLKKHLSL
ncbi:MAG: response regulator, partial [Candidatus Aureabacteria bacterium]|nr:response regulator [Candidatus Auribacterota bacterium]